MNRRRATRLVLLLCTVMPFAAVVGEDVTDSVSFQPIQTQGTLRGCSLSYSAFVRDRVYQKGALVFVVGNITVLASNQTAIVSLKVGLTDPASKPQRFTQPHFAYLQTSNASTAQLRHTVEDLDEGFRLFVFPLDDAATKLLLDMIEKNRVTIGYNRTLGGLDVLVPLDLTVASSDYDGATVQQKRSPDAVGAFANCMVRVLDQTLAPEKK